MMPRDRDTGEEWPTLRHNGARAMWHALCFLVRQGWCGQDGAGGWRTEAALMAYKRWYARRSVLVVTAALVVGCSDALGPERHGLRADAAGGGGIALDQWNGTLSENGTMLIKGFNPQNPHTGDAIIATFFWLGTTNIIDSVTDVLTTAPYSPVGNKYTLVEYVTAGGISMATYVATNVQNFPSQWDSVSGDSILAVRANLSVPVVDGGVMLSAWTGVNGVTADALGAHQSASGAGVSTTVADPGAIPVNAGALAYGVTMAAGPAGINGPPGFTNIVTMSDPLMKSDGEYDAEFTVQQTGGTVDPQWTWFFTAPSTWLATVLALNAAPPPPGNLTVSTTTTGSNLPTTGYTLTVDGSQSQPIPTTGSVTFTNLAAGSRSVALAGLPTNCTVSGTNPQTVAVPSGGTATVSFAVTCAAPPPGNLTVTTTTTGSNLPTTGYTATVDGTQSQSIPTNGSVTFTGLAAGSHSVLLSGVPTNCTVSGPNPQTVTVPSGGTATTSFTLSCAATPGTSGKMTGGGKLGTGHDFATFGFQASAKGGTLDWEQHCVDGATSSPCSSGGFSFHGTIVPGSYSVASGSANCRTWSGTGRLTKKNDRGDDDAAPSSTSSFTVNAACDNGEPGHNRDYIAITIGAYSNAGYLTGGNIELHKGS
jgi:hypothetical protein